VLRSGESSKFGFDRGKASVATSHAGEVDNGDLSPEAGVDGLGGDLGGTEDENLL
jgi:hypothetical protein